MIQTLRQSFRSTTPRAALVAIIVLLAAAYVGRQPSVLWLGLLVAGIGGAVLLARPVRGLIALVLVSLVVPFELGTGTGVQLNAATLLIPALLAIWLLAMLRRRQVSLAPSAANRPLALFLLTSLLSLLIGRATWDPMVPINDNFLLVQLAQWAIFAFSAGAFWLAGSLIKDQQWLWRLTAAFLVVGGGLAILYVLPGTAGIAGRFTTIAFIRAPFWVLLAGLAAGQLLFNRSLSALWRIFLALVLGISAAYAFVQQREAASNWVGLVAVVGTLIWLRFPRLRWPAVAIVAVLVALGVLLPSLYRFAGGDQEWEVSGGSRLALAQRVVEVTLRNPITGLGPAAYRPYANMKPLRYQNAYWISPQINSHNNYVDLFAHGGIVGLLLFFWFVWEVARLGLALRRRFTQDFAAGYVNGMLAAGAGALMIMLLADWILPFVYNIGFPGFQASMLVWLFMGGLVVLENMGRGDAETGGHGEGKMG